MTAQYYEPPLAVNVALTFVAFLVPAPLSIPTGKRTTPRRKRSSALPTSWRSVSESPSTRTTGRFSRGRRYALIRRAPIAQTQMCTYIAHTVYSTALCIIHMCIDTTAYVIEARLCYLVRLLGHSVVAVCSTPHSDRPPQWRHAFVTVSTPATNHKPGSFSNISLPNIRQHPHPRCTSFAPA